MARITGARFRDDTILRLGADGDNWHMSWAADDTQVVALCDGLGIPGQPRRQRNTDMFRLIGDPPDVAFEPLPGFPTRYDDPLAGLVPGQPRYYPFGTLACDGVIYQFLSTAAHAGGHWFGVVKLIYSDDDGATWRNQDGSTPVVWEAVSEQFPSSMVFWEEPDYSFALLAVLQMGRDYAANRDGYVYVYAPNGVIDGTMNELVMFRVPRDRVTDRSAYEFFAGWNSGEPEWSRFVDLRQPVHTFRRGWVNLGGPAIDEGDPPHGGHPYAWQPSVVYIEALDRYVMANWGMAHRGNDWFTAPNYLGLWSAPEPWGPWEQFYETEAWTPGGDLAARCYQPQIPPKWIAADGRSFWIAWTDFQPTVPGTNVGVAWERLVQEASSPEEYAERMAALRPYYRLNAQRVSLDVE
jgi:hypothetical protein